MLFSFIRVGKDGALEERKGAEGSNSLPVLSTKAGEKGQSLAVGPQKPLSRHLLSAPIFKYVHNTAASSKPLCYLEYLLYERHC